MLISQILIRIIMAICIGGFVGYEREMRNRPAGFMTHTLVCVGACVVSLIQIQMVEDTIKMIQENPALAGAMKADLGRVVAQVVTGVGFLGAGTIIFDKGSVKGLTTATTIWVVACIGLAIGLGYYAIAIIAAIGVIFIVIGLRQFELKARDHRFAMRLEVTYKADDVVFLEKVMKIFKKSKVQVRDIRMIKSLDLDEKIYQFYVYIGILRDREKVMEKLVSHESVIAITRL